jgi:AraC family transcriptional regulator
MEREAGEGDIVFRIGGDEFVMLTAHEDKKYADDICERIKSYNGQPIIFDGQEIPLNLHIGVTQFEGKNLRYRDLFEQLHIAILASK